MEIIKKSSDGFKLDGTCTLQALEPGLVSKYTAQGLTLVEAIQRTIAEKKIIHRKIVHNLVVNNGKYLTAALLINDLSFAGSLTYQAIGTNAMPALVTDVTLNAEVARAAYYSRTRSGNVITLDAFFLAADSFFVLWEAGVFGGIGASAILNSGTLFSHYILGYDNVFAQADLTYEYQLTVT